MPAMSGPASLSSPLASPLPPASRLRRFGAMLYEGVLLFGVVFVADYLFDTLTQSRHALMFRHTRQAWLFLILALYFVWFWTHGGQTLAMKTWHVRLVNRDGGPVTVGRALARFLLVWLPIALGGLGAMRLPLGLAAALLFVCASLPYLWSLFDRDGQFLHDRLLGTRLVMHKKSARPATSPSPS